MQEIERLKIAHRAAVAAARDHESRCTTLRLVRYLGSADELWDEVDRLSQEIDAYGAPRELGQE